MTSMERVLTALGHGEADRVPYFLLLTMHGAKETGVPLSEYFLSAKNVVEGQKRLVGKYGSDAYYNFHYASLEFEAWGGSTIFRDDGPANAGEPLFGDFDSLRTLEPPRVRDCPGLQRVLEVTRTLKEHARGAVPIIGVVMSPYSLPVMQLGFERYLDLMQDEPDLFARLMRVNGDFCVEWANAQLEAGATAICYFDPVSSPSIVPREAYERAGFGIEKEMTGRIKGATAIHLASGNVLPIADLLCRTGALAVGVSAAEDLAAAKDAFRGKLCVIGNMNGIAMRRWSAEDAAREVGACIDAAGQGGGFILSDNHGEIPWQVGDETLLAIAETVRTRGEYPLR